MKISRFLLVGILVAGGCAGTHTAEIDPVASSVPPADTSATAFQLEQDLGRVAASHVGGDALWPGYDPLAVPLAVYDGQRTTLFRHPAPPEGFVLHAPGVSVYEGRYPAITANSSADVGGVPTATVLLAGTRRPTGDLAPLAVHEAFHVFERAHHPAWAGNEADLFVYPTGDPDLLALRRLETEALRRAVADRTDPTCWARVALALRDERFAVLDSASAAYERGTELNEGLALYVESRAAGHPPTPLPLGGFAAAEVRLRSYGTGAALAVLLDRTDPDWRAPFDADPAAILDIALETALAAIPTTGAPCAFTPTERATAEEQARVDVDALASAHAADRSAFDALAGWRLVVVPAADSPLWPEGFDPLNVERVGSTDVLHARYLRFSNGSGHVEALDRADADLVSLTVGKGPHPVFNGVVRLVVAGLAEPEFVPDGDAVTVRAPGLDARFQDAEVAVEGRTITVRLKSG